MKDHKKAPASLKDHWEKDYAINPNSHKNKPNRSVVGAEFDAMPCGERATTYVKTNDTDY